MWLQILVSMIWAAREWILGEETYMGCLFCRLRADWRIIETQVSTTSLRAWEFGLTQVPKIQQRRKVRNGIFPPSSAGEFYLSLGGLMVEQENWVSGYTLVVVFCFEVEGQVAEEFSESHYSKISLSAKVVAQRLLSAREDEKGSFTLVIGVMSWKLTRNRGCRLTKCEREQKG